MNQTLQPQIVASPNGRSVSAAALAALFFSSFLAAGFNHDQLSTDEANGLVYSARLVGRSAWNTRWLLIIPGATFNADPVQGLTTFLQSVTDIRLVINSYGYSGN